MTRKPFVVANWKMNGSLKANADWIEAALPQMSGTRLHCDVAVCAPSVYLSQLVKGFEHSATLVGAQNCAQYTQGAYTGEVSAAMLADIGCDLVILGHHYQADEVIRQVQQTVAAPAPPSPDAMQQLTGTISETMQFDAEFQKFFSESVAVIPDEEPE